jgi:hypothetical protein
MQSAKPTKPPTQSKPPLMVRESEYHVISAIPLQDGRSLIHEVNSALSMVPAMNEHSMRRAWAFAKVEPEAAIRRAITVEMRIFCSDLERDFVRRYIY